MKQIVKIYHRLNTELSSKFHRQFIGETAEILPEKDGGQIYGPGLSERYFKVYPEKTQTKLKQNDLIRLKLVGYGKKGLYGEVL